MSFRKKNERWTKDFDRSEKKPIDFTERSFTKKTKINDNFVNERNGSLMSDERTK